MEKIPPSSIKHTTVRWVSWAKAELWLLLPLDDVGMSGREGHTHPGIAVGLLNAWHNSLSFASQKNSCCREVGV